MLNNKTILITGGTGSFGTKFTETLFRKYKPKKLIIFSRDEFKQYEMAKTVPRERVRFVLGDIRDKDRTYWAMHDCMPDYVIHAAALKHVASGINHPDEVVKTNILGTQNVIDSASRCYGVRRAVILSTDKACAPENFYGASKMIAERLWLSANEYADIFTGVRYGNVIGSSGSVLHVFNTQKDHGVFKVTDRRMTRFAVTFDYAVNLVKLALQTDAGNVLVSKVPAFKVVDLARRFDETAASEEIGITPGEKLHESLLTEYERARAIELDRLWILPPDVGEELPEAMCGYSSADGPFMTIDELREVVRVSV